MSCKTETTTIGEHEYSVTQWPAERSILTKFQLIKIFGAPLALLISGEDKESLDETDTDGWATKLSSGLSVLFQGSSPEEMFAIMKGCVVGVACDGKRITETSFNETFSGDCLTEVYQVFLFVLKVNYSNLLQGQLGKSLLAKVNQNL